MHDGRGVKHRRDERIAPELHVIFEPLLHGGVRNVAERVIGEMRQQIGEQDQAAREPQLPDADAGEDGGPRADSGLTHCLAGRVRSAAIHSVTSSSSTSSGTAPLSINALWKRLRSNFSPSAI